MSRIEQIKAMLKDDPGDAFLIYALALEHEKAGETTAAIELLVSLQNNQPGYLPLYYKLGKLYESLSRIPDAVQYYKKGINLAQQQNDTKTLLELKEALLQWEDED